MKRTIRSIALAFILAFLMGCGPRDVNQKFPLMKESMEWLKSYCENDVELMTLWRGQGVSIKFECSVDRSVDLTVLDTELAARGFSFVAEYKPTKTWCKDGIGFHVTGNQGMRASSYYPSSSCS
ncbi:hypothetical protein [Hylemonella gracilis]|uniref:hypothetical protein n=1 Tax=Hylemonella gracilis TaxID=80880 RepID=UPI00103F8706|nr:hypothetical protein [Hylemonella gracilis]